MKRFTDYSHCRLALACIGGGLLLLSAEEPLKGGRFSLIGNTTGGGGRADGGTYAVDGVIGQPSTAASSGGNFEVTGGIIGVAVVPGDVVITVESTEDGMARLTWPSNGVGLQLQFASRLGSLPDWKPVEPAPIGNVFITPMNQPLRVFRLYKP